MTADNAPIIPSSWDAARIHDLFDRAGLITPTWWTPDDYRKALDDDPSLLDDLPPEPVKVAVPDAPTDPTAEYVALVQSVAQGVVNALWLDGWRRQVATEPEPAPVAAEPGWKASMSGNGELTIVRMPRRVTVRTIERDKQGRIVRTVDVEEDVEA